MCETDEYIYLVTTECPACSNEFGQAERFDEPVGLMQNVPLSAKFCPHCGVSIEALDAEWDLIEEHEVARVLPAQEREEVAPDV